MNGRHRKPRRFGLPGKLTLSLAVLATTASLATAATYASWTSSASQSPTVSSGTVTVNLGATGASTNRLNVNATGIAPGDTIKRSVDLINAGSLDLASITLTTTATASSALDTDTTNGLQFQVDVCSQAWTESGSSPAFSYVCGGSTSAVLASRAIIGNSSPIMTQGLSLIHRHIDGVSMWAITDMEGAELMTFANALSATR